MSELLPTPEGKIEREVSPESSLEAEKNIEAAFEKGAEKANIEDAEHSLEKAKIEAQELALSIEKGGAEKKNKGNDSPATKRHGVISKKELNVNYKEHVAKLQSELPPSKRAFSKVIHNPAIEKTSEVVGSSIARPNAILAGAVVAFFAVLAVYLIAKHYGYVLSGFETIGAFIVGWVLGVLYDFFRVMITGKKS